MTALEVRPPAVTTAPDTGGGDDYSIRAVGVSKRFASYRKKATSLKERFVRRGGTIQEDFWALREVNVQIGHGQTVGLIGANGSGKSTLLKVLAGILRPSDGEVDVRGRIASLLELGAGFNGELSGRDNVYLNASLLGLSRKETDRLFDSIVAFAELEDFIDNLVKHYSSGMYVRLGFAIAVHTEPDVLLVDEVLAVGDEAFQQKCLAKIAEFQAEGRTILFVSHSLDLVERICDRTLVLDHGRLMFDGDPADGSRFLRGRLGTIGDAAPPSESGGTVHLTGIGFSERPGGPPRLAYDPEDPFTATVRLDAEDNAPAEVDLRAAVVGPFDIPIWVMQAREVPLPRGRSSVEFVLPHLPGVLGGFAVSVGVTDSATGSAVTATRFDDVFTIRAEHDHGLLGVQYTVSGGVAGPVPRTAAELAERAAARDADDAVDAAALAAAAGAALVPEAAVPEPAAPAAGALVPEAAGTPADPT